MAGLEELKKRLYKEQEGFGERMMGPELERKRRGETRTWKDLEAPKKEPTYIYWTAGVIFILAVAGAAVYFLQPFALFEAKEVEIEIIGERDVQSGARLTWEVKINNKSKRDLEDPVLVFNFPADATPIVGQRPPGIFRVRKPLGAIKSGESISETFDAYVFGGREAKKEVTAALEFRPSGMSAIYGSDAEFSFFIARAPISVSVDIPKELRIGQKIDFTIHYISQAEEIVKDLYLDAVFPGGFEFLSAFPQPTAGEARRWKIGDLKSGESGSIRVSGTIKGLDLETKILKVSIGTFDAQKKSLLPYDESISSIVLRSPFLEVSLRSGGKNDAVAFPGSEIQVEVFWRNNLDREIKDAILEVKLEGAALDFSSIRVENGVFKEAIKSAVWNAGTYNAFKNIPPGESGLSKLTFLVKNNFPLDSSSPRPVIRATGSLRSGVGTPGLEGVDLTGSSVFEVKVASRLQLVSKGFYFNAPIPNSGPIPPKVGQETTYNIVWSVTNMVNDVDGVVIKSILPPYMNFKEIISPADANVVFNANTGEIEWRVGKIFAGTGFLRPALQIAFQVGLIPSESQINKSPELADSASVEGRDTFTNSRLTAQADRVTTELRNDPGIKYGDGLVTR